MEAGEEGGVTVAPPLSGNLKSPTGEESKINLEAPAAAITPENDSDVILDINTESAKDISITFSNDHVAKELITGKREDEIESELSNLPEKIDIVVTENVKLNSEATGGADSSGKDSSGEIEEAQKTQDTSEHGNKNMNSEVVSKTKDVTSGGEVKRSDGNKSILQLEFELSIKKKNKVKAKSKVFDTSAGAPFSLDMWHSAQRALQKKSRQQKNDARSAMHSYQGKSGGHADSAMTALKKLQEAHKQRKEQAETAMRSYRGSVHLSDHQRQVLEVQAIGKQQRIDAKTNLRQYRGSHVRGSLSGSNAIDLNDLPQHMQEGFVPDAKVRLGTDLSDRSDISSMAGIVAKWQGIGGGQVISTQMSSKSQRQKQTLDNSQDKASIVDPGSVEEIEKDPGQKVQADHAANSASLLSGSSESKLASAVDEVNPSMVSEENNASPLPIDKKPFTPSSDPVSSSTNTEEANLDESAPNATSSHDGTNQSAPISTNNDDVLDQILSNTQEELLITENDVSTDISEVINVSPNDEFNQNVPELKTNENIDENFSSSIGSALSSTAIAAKKESITSLPKKNNGVVSENFYEKSPSVESINVLRAGDPSNIDASVSGESKIKNTSPTPVTNSKNVSLEPKVDKLSPDTKNNNVVTKKTLSESDAVKVVSPPAKKSTLEEQKSASKGNNPPPKEKKVDKKEEVDDDNYFDEIGDIDLTEVQESLRQSYEELPYVEDVKDQNSEKAEVDAKFPEKSVDTKEVVTPSSEEMASSEDRADSTPNKRKKLVDRIAAEEEEKEKFAAKREVVDKEVEHEKLKKEAVRRKFASEHHRILALEKARKLAAQREQSMQDNLKRYKRDLYQVEVKFAIGVITLPIKKEELETGEHPTLQALTTATRGILKRYFTAYRANDVVDFQLRFHSVENDDSFVRKEEHPLDIVRSKVKFGVVAFTRWNGGRVQLQGYLINVLRRSMSDGTFVKYLTVAQEQMKVVTLDQYEAGQG
eukprot:CAMPEP_0194373882 /NCGR_PEP_ID=MMETSP0174-20130528/22281_1 /TAXON_ID=216777 /ORGANISM="Proboscia alata, Strain PI-D3" /LENGTH=989 /DNA_ID=CAMNT_0039153161 /DNA_START=42 /DNA_END=3011 /DNA_ORIENTATION=-